MQTFGPLYWKSWASSRGALPPRGARGLVTLGAWLVAIALAGGCDGEDGSAAPGPPDARSFDATPDAEPPRPDAAPPDLTPEELYTIYCGFCHGADGEGYLSDDANAIGAPEFISTASDEFLFTSIVYGRPGTSMSPWGAARGGPLSDKQARDLVGYMRQWMDGPLIDVDGVTVDGVATRGQPPYAVYCASCHGEAGEGVFNEGVQVVTLNNPWFLHSASDGFIRYAIEHGRTDTPMPAYGESQRPQVIDDLVALIRSWAQPVDGTPLPPFEPDLTHALLNPDGPPADFTLREGRFAPADDVHAALVAGQSFIIADARPEADYLSGHIAGAVSTPFYDIADAVAVFPRDRWIITYCGCPHAVSGQAADAFLAAGFEKVAVLDEGFYVWAERGYPIREGTSP